MTQQLAVGQKLIIGACGICCNVCGLYVTKSCFGCVRDEHDPHQQVADFACPILNCSKSKNIDFCTRDCLDYPCGLYRHGLPICDRYLITELPNLSGQEIPSWENGGVQLIKQEPGPWQRGGDPCLYVFCLGPLRVFRDGKFITKEEWGGTKGSIKKVKALFAYLLAKGSCGATRDEIVELLWGDEPASDKTERRFHPTLYYLRRALEPDLAPRTESRFVLCREGRYRLDPINGYWVDAVAFENFVERAGRLEEEGHIGVAARYWKLAVSLYNGDYMADLDNYTEDYIDDCCNWRKQRLKNRYLTTLLNLATYYYQQHQDRLSLNYAQKALSEDHSFEEAHFLIMRLKYRAGQRAEVILQYRLCEQTLRDAEDRNPSPETVHLYQQCLQTAKIASS